MDTNDVYAPSNERSSTTVPVLPPLVDTLDTTAQWVCTGTWGIATNSPHSGTGCLADSQCGGWWGAELKFAGYDGMIVEGKAAEPVYIYIEDEKVEIVSAAALWGKITGDVQAAASAGLANVAATVLQLLGYERPEGYFPSLLA